MKVTGILTLGIAFALITACEKQNEPEKNSHRIREIEYDYVNNDYDSKRLFTYEGERMVEMVIYYKNESDEWEETQKGTVNYSGNTITEIFSYQQNGTWYTDYNIEISLENGRIIQETINDFEDDAWYEMYKTTYEYSGSHLAHWTYYSDYDDNGTITLTTKGDYIYRDGKLSELLTYNYIYMPTEGWDPANRDTFTFTNDLLTSYMRYIDILGWEKFSKSDFTYTSDKVTHIDRFRWLTNHWQNVEQRDYEYNAEGFLIQEQADSYTATFQYEEGHGNAELFYYNPDELIYDEPRIKSNLAPGKYDYTPLFKRLPKSRSN